MKVRYPRTVSIQGFLDKLLGEKAELSEEIVPAVQDTSTHDRAVKNPRNSLAGPRAPAFLTAAQASAWTRNKGAAVWQAPFYGIV